MSNSFSGELMTYGKKGRPTNTAGLQSAGSLRKRRLTNGTITTMTPDGSLHNKSTDFLHSRLSGSLLNPKNKFLFNTNNSSEFSQPFYIEENNRESSQNSMNSNEMMFYNYVANPIYEGPEIGQNFENPNLQEELMKPHNFSFNGQFTEKQAMQLQRNIKSGHNLRRNMQSAYQMITQEQAIEVPQKEIIEKIYDFPTENLKLKPPGEAKMFDEDEESRDDVSNTSSKMKFKNKGKRGKKEGKKVRRNFMRIFNSKEYDIDINKADEDPRTTLMIKNIPNKYTQNLLLGDVNEEFKDAYDFFYLPIDFDVKITLIVFRTNVTLDMPSLTLSTRNMLKTFISGIITKAGENSIAKK